MNSKILQAVTFLIIIAFIAAIVPPVSAGWTDSPTKPTVLDWANMANNVTMVWTLISQNQSTTLSAVAINNTAIMTGVNSNMTAISANGTVVMTNTSGTYNLTTTWAQIITNGQSLNFTTSGAGTYLIDVDLRGNLSIATVNGGNYLNWTSYAICDANGTTPVTNTERMDARITDTKNFTATARHFTWIYRNSTGAAEVGVCGMVSQAQPGFVGIASDAYGRSVLSYVKLP